MSKPTQYELVSLYYQAKAAGVAGTDLDVLNDVKTKWKAAHDKLNAEDTRGYTMTAAEITAEDDAITAQQAADNAALIALLNKELTEEQAGFNRPEVITEIQGNIAALGG